MYGKYLENNLVIQRTFRYFSRVLCRNSDIIYSTTIQYNDRVEPLEILSKNILEVVNAISIHTFSINSISIN